MAENVKIGQIVKGEFEKKLRGLILYPPKCGKHIDIRFVGIQQKIYQQWDNQLRRFFCSERNIKGYVLRIASFVIDREDEKVKAFLCPLSAFNKISNISSKFGSDCDFKIFRTGVGLNTKYEVTGNQQSVVDDKLLKQIEITSKVYSLSNIFVNDMKWELVREGCEPVNNIINNRFEILDL